MPSGVPTIVNFLVVVFICHHVLALNECERGVKRPHPSQANVYQLFTRASLRKQWIDHQCEKYTVFDPSKCACVEKPRDSFVEVSKGDELESNPDGDGNRNSQTDISKNDSPENDIQVGEDLTAKDDEDNCHLHQPSASSPSHFERWTDGQWVVEDCNFPFYTGLVWNQLLCRCEWGANRTAPIAVLDSDIPASCLMMLHVTFDEGEIKDEGRGVWIDVKRKEGAAVVEDRTAVGGYAGSFRGTSMVVPFFKSNTLGPTFHIGLRFKLCQGDPDTDIFLVHNDCPESSLGPSLVVSYQAWKQQITITMTTEVSEVPTQLYCDVTNGTPQASWVKLDIRYHDNHMKVTLNDEVCATDNTLIGPVATNNCPLTLLGESFCGSVDEVIITRGCTEEDHAIS